MSRRNRRLIFEVCESRHFLTQIGLAQQSIGQFEMGASRSMAAGDLDGDGDLDLVSESLGGGIGWRPLVGGEALFGPTRFVTAETDRFRHVLIGDVDSDNDNDIVSIGDHLVWFENLDGAGTFGPSQLFDQRVGQVVKQAALADLDADGDLDLIRSATKTTRVDGNYVIESDTLWYENIDGRGNFERKHEIIEASSQFAVRDLDGDQDLDLVVVTSGKLHRFQNVDGRGTFVDDGLMLSGTSYVGMPLVDDVDNNGRLDVILRQSSDLYPLRFEESEEGRFALVQVVNGLTCGFPFSDQCTLALADADGDADLDLFMLRSGTNSHDYHIHWSRFNDRGRFARGGQFRSTATIGGSVGLLVADFDGDRSAEVVYNTGPGDNLGFEGSGQSNLSLLHQFDRELRRYDEGQVFAMQGDPSISVIAADVNGDGDLDLIFNQSRCLHSELPCHNTISWRENLDGQGTWGTPQQIDYELGSPFSPRNQLLAADIDGDGDVDAMRLHAYGSHGSSVWFENVDGKGQFGSAQPVLSQPVESPVLEDFDGDGDADLLFAIVDRPSTEVYWSEQRDGAFRDPARLTTVDLIYRSLDLLDDDGDGDLDLFVTDKLGRYRLERLDKTEFGPAERLIRHEHYVRDADLDGDGDLDVLLSILMTDGERGEVLAWSENLGGLDDFGPIQSIDTTRLFRWQIDIADVDSDDDLDLVTHSSAGLVWYENTDGRGDFRRREMPRGSEMSMYSSRFAIADLDKDGDLDVLGNGVWYENRPTGDVNDDGRFDSTDLVAVMQRGKYEDDVPRNATFEDGDWDGDSDFDSGDLVLAFQSGHYEAAARPLEAEIPAAVEAVYAESDRERSNTFVP